MPKRSSKGGRRRDVNELAARIAAVATGDDATVSVMSKAIPKEKNLAAVELGRLGGLRGGKARAAKLSAKKRKEIAQLGAAARWSKVTEKEKE